MVITYSRGKDKAEVKSKVLRHWVNSVEFPLDRAKQITTKKLLGKNC